MRVAYITRPLSDAAWKRAADCMMDAMFDEGVLTARPRLTGTETGIFAVPAEFEPVPEHAFGMTIIFQPDEEEFLWVDLMFVTRGRRNEGIGTELLNAAVAYGRFHKLPDVQLGTMFDNQPMIGLAQKCGFTGTRVDFRREIEV